jgi:hypothetical protein
MNKNSKDICLGGLLVVGFSILYFAVIPFAIVVPKNIKILALSPAFWPRITTAVIVLLGLSLLIGGIIKKKTGTSLPLPDRSVLDTVQAKSVASYKRPILIMVALLVYLLIIEFLGITMASMIGFLLFTAIFGEKRLKILFPITILLPVCLYYFFVKVANIPLPIGIWEQFL